jgi:hypothetical protein
MLIGRFMLYAPIMFSNPIGTSLVVPLIVVDDKWVLLFTELLILVKLMIDDIVCVCNAAPSVPTM